MDADINSMINLMPIDVIIGFIFLFVFGLILGAAICLPYVHKHSTLPLEKLIGDWIWHYKPDLVLCIIGCVIFIVMSFLLISGIWRIF
ncbi:MAG: hypothetical protein IJQ16_10585 [Selenomonadaceae bacterium]|nr:hypothetical protein [Selenomonadaceae bacterium]